MQASTSYCGLTFRRIPVTLAAMTRIARVVVPGVPVGAVQVRAVAANYRRGAGAAGARQDDGRAIRGAVGVRAVFPESVGPVRSRAAPRGDAICVEDFC
jgi:hypothetical protein